MIGRKEKQTELQQIVESKQSEFVAIFGRRRVSKTFLIREFFGNRFVFYHTGIANSKMAVQLNSFSKSLTDFSKISFPKCKTWFDAFENLAHLLENSKIKGKKLFSLTKCLGWTLTNRALCRL